MGEFDSRVFGIINIGCGTGWIDGVSRVGRVSGIHSVTPISVRTRPAMGVSGMKGHKIIKTRLMRPPRMMLMQPIISKINLEKKPTMREMRRSVNI